MNTTTPHSPAEEIEEAAEVAGVAVAASLRGIEIAAAVLLALLVCPPLLILVVVVVVPLVAIAVLVSLVAAVFATPYFLVRHLRGHRGDHVAVLARLRHAGHALVDLLPHRLFA
jgi:cobalamin synthase